METNKYRKKLEIQLKAAFDDMEKKRNELAEITKAIEADLDRSINSDHLAWEKNKELSKAIHKYVQLEKLLNKGKSDF